LKGGQKTLCDGFLQGRGGGKGEKERVSAGRRKEQGGIRKRGGAFPPPQRNRMSTNGHFKGRDRCLFNIEKGGRRALGVKTELELKVQLQRASNWDQGRGKGLKTARE